MTSDPALAPTSLGSATAHDIAADLRQHLTRVQFSDLPAHDVTALLTHAIIAWGVSKGWMPRTEVPSTAIRQTPTGDNGHHGYLDILFDRWGEDPVVIEVDRGNKRWSVEKLDAEVERGATCLWVRWGRRERVGDIPDRIGLVHIPVRSRRGVPRLYTCMAK